MQLAMQEVRLIADQFEKLMSEDHPEQRYQEYLEKHTRLIPREFVQNHGINCKLILRKLSLSKDYTPDFFYLAKSSADWNLVLVEIEKPRSRYFKEGTNDLHAEFLAGLDQIARWRAWFDIDANRNSFIEGTIAPIRVPDAMKRNPCRIRYVLVHGRRAEFEGNEKRRGLIRAREASDFHIISFDSLLEDLESKSELYVGVRKNEYVEIVSEKFVGEHLFSWMEPSELKINDRLREDILAKRAHWFHRRVGFGYVLDEVLPLIGRCN